MRLPILKPHSLYSLWNRVQTEAEIKKVWLVTQPSFYCRNTQPSNNVQCAIANAWSQPLHGHPASFTHLLVLPKKLGITACLLYERSPFLPPSLDLGWRVLSLYVFDPKRLPSEDPLVWGVQDRWAAGTQAGESPLPVPYLSCWTSSSRGMHEVLSRGR